MPTQRRRRTAVLALPLAAALVLGACSSGSGGGNASGGGDANPTTVPGGQVVDGSGVPGDASTVPVASTTSIASTTTIAATTTTVAPTTTTPPDPTQQPEPAGPLQSGSKGTRTRALQQALVDQHYDPGPIDGQFGNAVTQAVWAYQALHGLPKDGVVSPELEARILAKEDQAMLKPDAGPTHTEVDLTRQVMLVWRDGALKLVTHVSSGSGVAYCENTSKGKNCGDAVTPTGSYTYQRRIEGWREAPLGKLYNPVYFVGGIAVHGASSVPNRPASHGCVRVSMRIAEYFPTLVNNGDAIVVFRS